MARLSRGSSQSSARAGDAPEIFTFPAVNVSSRTSNSSKHPLSELLADEPSMFDNEQVLIEQDPQALSTAPTAVLQGIVSHRGAVELIRRLSTLLAERDAHITALTRLAEEYKIPDERINDTASRVKRSERRRLSLAAASEDHELPSSGLASDSNTYNDADLASLERYNSRGSSALKEFTKLFSGKPALKVKPRSRESSISTAQPRTRSERALSVDVRSIQSVQSGESSAWKDTAGNLFKSAPKRRDSQNDREPVEMKTRLDKTQLPPTLVNHASEPQEAAWNRFILHLMKARQQNGDLDGNIGMIGASRFGHEGQEGRQRMHSLTRLVIEGVPIQMRHSIWMELSNVDAMVQPQTFQHFLALGEAHDNGEREAILKDVPRTLTSKYDFYADKGYVRLKEVLVAFVGKYKELGYTQGLNSIAGYLLLTIPVREDAFWMLCNIVENFFPSEYFSGKYAMEAPQFDNSLLRSYIKQLMPQLGRHLDEINIPDTHTVPMKWFFTAFSNVVSEALLLRIWDVWLCLPNQKHFLFNIALMLLLYNYDELMACDSDSACYALLDNELKFPTEQEKITKFIRDAFGLGKKLEDLDEKRSQGLKWRLRRVGSVECLVDEPSGGEDSPKSPVEE